MNRRNWPAIALVILVSVAASSTNTTVRSSNANSSFEQRELAFSGALHRASQFAGVAHISSRPSCGEVQPPEEIETPNPLLTSSAQGQKVKVSFIIGTDGKVHSPLILESAGMSGDSARSSDGAHLEISSRDLQRRSHRDGSQDRVFQPVDMLRLELPQ